MKKLFFLLCAFLIGVYGLSAQERIIKGKVVDENGIPLIGTNVFVKGSSSGTMTDIDGLFELKTPSEADTLVFSFLGFTVEEVPINGKNEINVTLIEDASSLSEVVVIGYGTQNKRNLTDNVVRLDSKDIEGVPTPNLFNAVTGKVSGVQVTQTNGKVDAAFNFRIRGQASISAGTSPLIVLDGIPLIDDDASNNGASSNPLITLNPNEIESIDILKDASSVAIYGSRGANGVVIITTKSGKAGKPTFSLNLSSGISKATNTLDFMNARQYVDFFTEAAENVGLVEDLEEVFDEYAAGTDWRNSEVDEDWQGLAFRQGYIRDANFSMSGGSTNTSYFISGGYNKTEGILVGNDIEKLNSRVNLKHDFNNKLTLGMNLAYAKAKINRVANDDEFVSPIQSNIQLPINPAFVDGEPNNNTFYDSFVRHDANSFYETNVRTVTGKLFGEYRFTPSLKFNSDLGFGLFSQSEDSFIGSKAPSQSTNGQAFASDVQTDNYIFSNYFTYVKDFNDRHSLNIVLGTEINESKSRASSVTGTQFPSDDFTTIDNAAEITAGRGSNEAYSFLSYFTRVSYTLNDRYLFKASLRYDGSSRFGSDNRYGTFPAFSAGWIISDEEFLKDSKLFSFLKLRGSWGQVGNAEIGNFASRRLFRGNSYNRLPGITPSQSGNVALTWESSTQTDVGVEFGLWNDRITGNVAYYLKDTDGLLFEQPIVPSAGAPTNSDGDTRGVTTNIGRLFGRGIEFSLETKNILTDDLRWTTSFNLGQNINEVKSLVNGNDVVARATILREGEPVNAFYLLEFAGVDPANGDGLYYLNTRNADGSLNRGTTNDPNEAERVVVGNPNPEWIGGFTSNLVYKNLDFSFTFQGEWGAEIFHGGALFYSANGSYLDNQTTDQLRRWRAPGDITDVPQARYDEENGTAMSTRYLENGNYVRLRNLTLGYTLPETLFGTTGVKARIYFSGLNLLTFTKYKGYDPESRTDIGDIGEDFYSAPAAKTYSMGINLNF